LPREGTADDERARSKRRVHETRARQHGRDQQCLTRQDKLGTHRTWHARNAPLSRMRELHSASLSQNGNQKQHRVLNARAIVDLARRLRRVSVDVARSGDMVRSPKTTSPRGASGSSPAPPRAPFSVVDRVRLFSPPERASGIDDPKSARGTGAQPERSSPRERRPHLFRPLPRARALVTSSRPSPARARGDAS
jgi:hypothetical protein